MGCEMIGEQDYDEQLQKMLKACNTVIESSSNFCSQSCQQQFLSFHACYNDCKPTTGPFLRLENTSCIRMLQAESRNVHCGPMEAWMIVLVVVCVLVFVLLALLMCRSCSQRARGRERLVIIEQRKPPQASSNASERPLALA